MTRCAALIRSLVAELTLIWAVSCPAAESEFPQTTVPTYGYEVVSRLRFDRANFTQGLEIFDGRLYGSSGLYGESMIRVYDFPRMDEIQAVPVDSRIFAEGLTVIDNRLVVLSWRERVILVYSLPDLSLLGQSALPGQGWGATHSGSTLWFSDGSHYLYSADMNGDGKLTIADVAAALLHQQSLQGTGRAPPCALAAADLDADGELGGADVEALRKLVVGE